MNIVKFIGRLSIRLVDHTDGLIERGNYEKIKLNNNHFI